MDIDYTLYLVTDQFDLTENEFLNVIEESIIGGTTVVQLREKDSSTKEFYNLAVRIKEITDKYSIPLIINDRLDIAQAVDSAGVHLGQSDMPCSVARKILGNDKIIGISAHNLDEARNAVSDGADYLGVGAIYHTDTKLDANYPKDDEIIEITSNINIPSVAIGGINVDNAHEVTSKYDFDGIAVVSAIMKSDNPQETSKILVNKVKN